MLGFRGRSIGKKLDKHLLFSLWHTYSELLISLALRT